MPSPSQPVCARCPRALGASCCEVKDTEHLATLTLADVSRIAAATGRSPASFSEAEWLSDEEAMAYEARRPLYADYFRHQPRRLTLRRQGGACVFLDRQRGCTLLPDVRPTACRLYPFELWPDGTWSLQVERHGSLESARGASGSACLAVEEAEKMEDVLAAFGLTQRDVEGLGARLAWEVREHARLTSPGAEGPPDRRAPRRRS
jgi:Fe-S-cluster containining protein